MRELHRDEARAVVERRGEAGDEGRERGGGKDVLDECGERREHSPASGGSAGRVPFADVAREVVLAGLGGVLRDLECQPLQRVPRERPDAALAVAASYDFTGQRAPVARSGDSQYQIVEPDEKCVEQFQAEQYIGGYAPLLELPMRLSEGRVACGADGGELLNGGLIGGPGDSRLDCGLQLEER